MKLIVDRLDLKPEFEDISCSQTRLEHFKPEVQAAITAVGRATFREYKGDKYNAIIVPDTAVPTQPDLDEKGFVFIDKQQRPFWCCLLGGDPWVCYWHTEQMWVTLRRVEMSDVAAARTMAIPEEQAEIYHRLHQEYLDRTAVTLQEETNE